MSRADWIICVPVLSQCLFYMIFPGTGGRGVLFLPQLISYASLVLWLSVNSERRKRLGIVRAGWGRSLLLGGCGGLITGGANLFAILKISPLLGYNIDFLWETPHAKLPFFLMMPFGILSIACFVELNFRSFLMGRLLSLSSAWRHGPWVAIFLSALIFSYDPFIFYVFRKFHWLALSDGLVWGYLFHKTGSFIAPLSAHSVEVIILYGVLKIFYA